MEIESILKNIYPLPMESFDKFIKHLEYIELPKGYNLIKSDKLEHKIYFIEKGIVRAYAVKEEEEVTFWFGEEGAAIISINNYIHKIKSYEEIELLEDCILYQIQHAQLQELYDSDIHIANWGRKFAEREYSNTEHRLINLQCLNAKERYLQLIHDHPNLLQRVKLGHIASYLGITQVSLSRIRAEINH